MARFKTTSLIDFGSLNEDVNPQAIAANELTLARECWQDGNTFGTRPGIQREGAGAGRYNADIAGPPAIEDGTESRNGPLDPDGALSVICGDQPGRLHYESLNITPEPAGLTKHGDRCVQIVRTDRPAGNPFEQALQPVVLVAKILRAVRGIRILRQV